MISNIPIDKLNKLLFPNSPAVNVDYVMNWNGDNYDILPATFKNTGTKWKIPLGETISVKAGHQYIIHDRIDVEGIMDIEGELVIL